MDTSYRFLDEAGDTTFYGKGKVPIIGQPGVTISFAIGMAKFNSELGPIRQRVLDAQQEITQEPYLNKIHSVVKKISEGGFFFHATDDPPEVRQIFYKIIKSIDCSLEIYVARKKPDLFAKKHDNKEEEFYADVLSHLIKNKFHKNEKLVLTIAQRGNSTKNSNLQKALQKAIIRFGKNPSNVSIKSKVVFNVQNHRTEPLLNITDYLCWAVQRVFEKGETRYYDYLQDKIRLVVDLYDFENYQGSKNYYKKENPLTSKNKLSPPPY